MAASNIKGRYMELISSNLDEGEHVDLVVKQSRLWPGVPLNSVFKPVLVFLTNERVIIVSRHNLGLYRNVTIVPLSAIITIRLERGLLLSSIVMGQLGATSGEINIISGFTHSDARFLLNHLNKQIHRLTHVSLLPTKKNSSGLSPGERCYNCGEPILKGAKYCYHCGVRLF
ncbi:MAG: PH domain-containing protein [Candidatus Micrarchaeota archaeon]|nr:PH domain-containing protein [Candidatus Micrarchaeota archaeon]